MDLPSPMEQIAHYRASLGHKINHSFRPNCRWSVCVHPVFGRVPAVVVLEEVPAGQELTCHYMIDMAEAGQDARLDWYVREWERESKEESRETEASKSSQTIEDSLVNDNEAICNTQKTTRSM